MCKLLLRIAQMPEADVLHARSLAADLLGWETRGPGDTANAMRRIATRTASPTAPSGRSGTGRRSACGPTSSAPSRLPTPPNARGNSGSWPMTSRSPPGSPGLITLRWLRLKLLFARAVRPPEWMRRLWTRERRPEAADRRRRVSRG